MSVNINPHNLRPTPARNGGQNESFSQPPDPSVVSALQDITATLQALATRVTETKPSISCGTEEGGFWIDHPLVDTYLSTFDVNAPRDESERILLKLLIENAHDPVGTRALLDTRLKLLDLASLTSWDSAFRHVKLKKLINLGVSEEEALSLVPATATKKSFGQQKKPARKSPGKEGAKTKRVGAGGGKSEA